MEQGIENLCCVFSWNDLFISFKTVVTNAYYNKPVFAGNLKNENFRISIIIVQLLENNDHTYHPQKWVLMW